jgi:hypothetical protein
LLDEMPTARYHALGVVVKGLEPHTHTVVACKHIETEQGGRQGDPSQRSGGAFPLPIQPVIPKVGDVIVNSMCLQPQPDGRSAKRKRQRRTHFHDNTANPYTFPLLTGYQWQSRRGKTDLKKFSAVWHQRLLRIHFGLWVL